MAFHFRLEKILHFVRLKETVKKMEVAAAIQRVQFMTDRLEQLSIDIRSMLARFHSSEAQAWSQYHSAKIAHDAREVKKAEKILFGEKENLARKKRDLERIFKKKKSLESLKEKRLEEYRLEESRKQQKRLDDIYQMSQSVSRFE